jgi:hypothetical protein
VETKTFKTFQFSKKNILMFQLMVTKSVEEMGKLYPDDLGEKVRIQLNLTKFEKVFESKKFLNLNLGSF